MMVLLLIVVAFLCSQRVNKYSLKPQSDMQRSTITDIAVVLREGKVAAWMPQPSPSPHVPAPQASAEAGEGVYSLTTGYKFKVVVLQACF